MRSIGVDIGSFSIKIVELDTSSRGVKLISQTEIPFGPDSTSDRRVLTLEVLHSLAAKALQTDAKVTLAVGQHYISLRHKIFPFRERHKIQKSLAFELEEDIPLDSEKAVYEAKILHYRKNSSEVLALACEKSAIQDILDLCQAAQFEPDIISMEAAALASLFEDWSSAPREILDPAQSVGDEGTSTELTALSEPGSLLLHMGHRRTLLLAFHGGALISARTIFFGGEDLVRAIQKKYNVPYPEALKGLMEKGFVLTSEEHTSHDQLLFSNTITETLREMTDEVRRSIIELQSDFNLSFSSLNISGGVSQLLNIAPLFTQAFEIPCNIYSSFTSFGGGFDDATQARCGLALGLAIEGARRPSNPAVNFRKDDFAIQNEGFKFFFEKWGYGLQIAGGLLALWLVASVVRDNFASQLTEKVDKVVRQKGQEVGLKKNESSPTKVQRYVREKQKEIKNRKTLAALQDINHPVDVMLRLSNIAPAKEKLTLDVRHFKLENEWLTIEGFLGSGQPKQDLESSLNSLAIDKKIQPLAPTLNPETGRMAFAYKLKVDRRLKKGGGTL